MMTKKVMMNILKEKKTKMKKKVKVILKSIVQLKKYNN